MQSHPLASIPLYGSVVLERAAYYGLRACLVLFLMSETIGARTTNAFEIYGMGTSVLAASYLLGGILGLLKQSKIVSLCGMTIQLIGMLILGFSTLNYETVLGFGLIAFGTGIHRPNMLTFLGQLYNRSKLLDSALMINYVMLNLGAFLGVLLATNYALKHGYKPTFLLCAALMAGSVLLLFFSNDTEKSIKIEKPVSDNEFALIPIMIALALIGSVLFWVNFEQTSLELMTVTFENPSLEHLKFPFSSELNFVVIIILGSILGLLFTFTKVATSMQLAIGFLCATISIYLLFNFANGADFITSAALILISFYIIQTVAEVFIGPPIMAYILRKTNRMFAPLVIGGFYFLSSIGTRIYSGPTNRTFYEILEWGTWSMLFFTAIFISIYFIRKNTMIDTLDKDATTYPNDDSFI